MNPIQNSPNNPVGGVPSRGEAGVGRNAAVGGSGVSASTSATAPAGAPAPGSDTVSISSSARQLNAAAAASVSGVPEARIAELRASIASGTYQIDPQKIAKGLVRDSRALQNASNGSGGQGSTTTSAQAVTASRGRAG